MLKLKLQYFGHLMQRVDSLEKTLMLGDLGAGREGDNRGWDDLMASPTQWTWIWVNFGSWWWTGRPGVLWSMGSLRVGHDWATELNFPDGSVVRNPLANAGDIRDLGLNPGSGRSPRGGHGNPLQYSCLENPHGQRSLAGYSPWGRRVGYHWVTKQQQRQQA